ncbi:hypothetical protein HIM_05422 [Hirsutella minnesotensis 3608]|uniref:6-methylsalicylate decarboxylase n=1 Tax=Hirsutella minnesotensis 3608 TaxID=1043627 RepID=A0A0F7ZUP6_9HYPO|nr:hypothetical protein HIM_05422 [Hirsutella minnesotensis 3608]
MGNAVASPKIDVHHHIIPPAFKKAWEDNPALSQGFKLPSWSPGESLEFMQRHNISTSILSLGAPATSMGVDGHAVAAFCREMNRYAADLCKQHPRKFGFMATLPSLEDTAACIEELCYALDELGADGVNLLTSYGGKYLGHPQFGPVWDELDRRSAVVFIHPGLETAGDPIREPRVLPAPIVDWTHETTRTATHLITTGTFRRHAACKIILPHGGGTLPYVARRVATLSAAFGLVDGGKTAEEFLDEARSFYYDVAFAGYQEPLRLLLDFAKPGHVLYGSDYPFGREAMVEEQLKAVDKIIDMRVDADDIRRGAAIRLWPRLGRDAD